MKIYIFLLMLLFKLSILFCQTNYVGVISDTCGNYSDSYKYTSQAIGTPSQGSIWKVFKNNIQIASGGGGLGCCYVVDIQPLTDSVIFVAISNQGLVYYLRTIDAGLSWTNFGNVGVIEFTSSRFFSKNTGFCMSVNPYSNKVKIIRVSDTNPKTIYYESIDTSNTQVYINDTIFSEPYCPEINELIYRINKDGIDIDYHIVFSKIITNPKLFDNKYDTQIFPNPSNGSFTINLEFDCTMEIFEMSGKLIQKRNLFRGKNDIDIGENESGFYLIRLQTSKNKIDKIIIKN